MYIFFKFKLCDITTGGHIYISPFPIANFYLCQTIHQAFFPHTPAQYKKLNERIVLSDLLDTHRSLLSLYSFYVLGRSCAHCSLFSELVMSDELYQKTYHQPQQQCYSFQHFSQLLVGCLEAGPVSQYLMASP